MNPSHLSQRSAAEPPTDGEVPKLAAVIDIGTTAVRMAIGEHRTNGAVRILERLAQAVSLGKDTFRRGVIEKSTIEDCVRVLGSFRKKLDEYQIPPEAVRAVGTSAVREALNRLAFLDRIYVATGIEVDPLDEAEVSRITYHGVRPQILAEPELHGAHTLVVEVGGGNTEVLLMQDGDIEASHSYRMGSLRLQYSLETMQTPQHRVRDYLRSQIRRTIQLIRQEIPIRDPLRIVALGGDMRFAASALECTPHESGLTPVPTRRLSTLANLIVSLSPEEVVHRYHISFQDTETLGPALLAYATLAQSFELDHVLVTSVNLREGLLREVAGEDAWTEDFRRQVINSAMELGRRYEIDFAHAKHVADLSTRLFRELQPLHRLSSRYELILHLAALLHEVGLYVSSRSYHKHTLYLLRNSELFGLSQQDMGLVAMVARYHRRSSPMPSHDTYWSLPRERRTAVSKLAAMMRVALALDESRSQRISAFACERRGGRLILATPDVEDLSLEQMAIKQNVSLFEEVFGMQVFLRRSVKSVIAPRGHE